MAVAACAIGVGGTLVVASVRTPGEPEPIVIVPDPVKPREFDTIELPVDPRRPARQEPADDGPAKLTRENEPPKREPAKRPSQPSHPTRDTDPPTTDAPEPSTPEPPRQTEEITQPANPDNPPSSDPVVLGKLAFAGELIDGHTVYWFNLSNRHKGITVFAEQAFRTHSSFLLHLRIVNDSATPFPVRELRVVGGDTSVNHAGAVEFKPSGNVARGESPAIIPPGGRSRVTILVENSADLAGQVVSVVVSDGEHRRVVVTGLEW